MKVLGIDVGGTGIKGAVVDTDIGELTTDRLRISTPQPATPEAVVSVIGEIARSFAWTGPIGCGVPGVVRHGVAEMAINLSPEWRGVHVEELVEAETGCPTSAANDADLAGLAEMRFGVGRAQRGTVLVVTLGTGIGTALFHDRRLYPNTELGHAELDGKDAEKRASAVARERKELSWKKWAKHVDRYLNYMHGLIWPELFIIGGGVSKKHEKFFPFLTVPAPVVPAMLENTAGIVGAATFAAERIARLALVQ